MKLRHLLAFAAVLMMTFSASAATKYYQIDSDQSTLFPTNGTILRPGTNSGLAVIDTAGPTLTTLVVTNAFIDIVGGTTTTNIPGTTVTLDGLTTLQPALGGGHGGTGSVDSSINWGSLTSWSQTGRLGCVTHCPGGCSGASSCIQFVGFEGTGPPAPLESTTFNTDPWTFANGGFSSVSFETVNLGSGAVTANLTIGSQPTVPALPLLGVAGLGAALVYLGTRAIRRNR